jgi:hypothetical protein
VLSPAEVLVRRRLHFRVALRNPTAAQAPAPPRPAPPATRPAHPRPARRGGARRADGARGQIEVMSLRIHVAARAAGGTVLGALDQASAPAPPARAVPRGGA